jgi:hypothetical protein
VGFSEDYLFLSLQVCLLFQRDDLGTSRSDISVSAISEERASSSGSRVFDQEKNEEREGGVQGPLEWFTIVRTLSSLQNAVL